MAGPTGGLGVGEIRLISPNSLAKQQSVVNGIFGVSWAANRGAGNVDKSKKSALVAKLNKAFAESELVVVTKPVGLNVGEISNLRRKLRDNGARIIVSKNRLAKIALKGTAYEGLSGYFTGPTAVAFSSDPVAAAKACFEFSKENEKLQLVAGASGGAVFDAEGVKALAQLPGINELRAKLVGLLQAPAGKLVGVVQAPARQLAQLASAYGAKNS